MSVQHHHASIPALGSERPTWSNSLVRALLYRLGRLHCGELVVELPSGHRLVLEGLEPGPQARLAINSWRSLSRIARGWDIGAAEAYMAGEWSSLNLVGLLTLASRNRAVAERLKPLRAPRLGLRLAHALNRNTQRGSRRNVAAHYDLGNEFYARWLDAGMTYSAGLFCSVSQTLEDAQKAKIDRVIDLLALEGGEQVLEIGCGWGSFAERLLQRHDCAVTAITLSVKQLAHAKERLCAEAEAGRCDLRLQDYREVQGTFDRIVSIEMLEAVGEAYWTTYFEKLRHSLRPGGTAVLQVITIDEARYRKYLRKPDFIQKYIFPGGMLPTVRILEFESAKAGLDVVSREFFGESYARTLAHWTIRFQEAWPEIKSLGFDERFKRMWDYYLAYCQAGFESGTINVGLYKLAHNS